VRLKGIKILTINHGEYALNEGMPDEQEAQSPNDTAERFSAVPPANVSDAKESDREGYR